MLYDAKENRPVFVRLYIAAKTAHGESSLMTFMGGKAYLLDLFDAFCSMAPWEEKLSTKR